ncbi:hypothetical protein BJF79_12965 [Actinomadura sp. CNU-125]|uniref:hypothetical protein n=1 Tax=Actinomadura sp. CNU-125 TaxID=1904961 RepID=UPI000961AB30|nr:hypothetical protein [Actinomadura sp. CNU-125]OLT25073.1 hypothetical protein BJF79_12965 [Actinomadura sp. CNU-125]
MKKRFLAALMAAPLGIALAAPPAQAAPAAPAATAPSIDLGTECPPLPAGQDPALTTCMVIVVAGGSMKLGGITQEISEEMRIVAQATQTSVSAPLEFTNVRLSGKPMKIPGGVFGLLGYPIPAIEDWPLVKIEVQPEYVGNFGFNLPSVTLDMKIGVLNTLAPEGCAIGSDQDPMKLDLGVDITGLEVVDPGDPSNPYERPTILRAPANDSTFAVPKTSGCWLLGPITDALAGLPSASGNNTATFDTYLALASYDSAPGQSADPVQRLKNIRSAG